MPSLVSLCLRIFLGVAVLAGLSAPHSVRAQEVEKDKGTVSSKMSDWFGGDKPEFFRMPPFTVPTIRKAGVVGQISLLVSIEVVGLDNKKKVMEKRHYLQSAFLRDLYGVASINNCSGQALQLDTVKRRLKMVADRMLGAGVIKTVLVENAHTRPIN